MMGDHSVAAMFVSAFGMAGSLIAQTSDAPSSVAPYVGGGSAVAAVGGLVYVARKMSNGDLVAVKSESREQELFRIIEGQIKVIDEQREDKRQMRDLIAETNGLQKETNRIIGRYANIIDEVNK